MKEESDGLRGEATVEWTSAGRIKRDKRSDGGNVEEKKGWGEKEEWVQVQKEGEEERVMERAGRRGEIENGGIREGWGEEGGWGMGGGGEEMNGNEVRRGKGWQKKKTWKMWAAEERGEVRDVNERWKRGGVESKNWWRERGTDRVIESGGRASDRMRKTGEGGDEVNEKWGRIRISDKQ